MEIGFRLSLMALTAGFFEPGGRDFVFNHFPVTVKTLLAGRNMALMGKGLYQI